MPREPQPMPRVARRAAALAGVAWIVAAFELAIVGLGAVMQTTVPSASGPIFLVATVAALVTLRLGRLLFAPTRRVLMWSTLWAAILAAGAAIVAVALPKLAGPPEVLAVYGAFPVVAGLLSLLAWRQLPSERPPSPPV